MNESVIDTHVHFWKYNKVRDAWINNDMKILQQDYLPQQLELNLKRNGVDGCVAVQVEQSELENLFLLELAKTHPIIKGIVGWVDLRDNNLESRLQYFSQFPLIKGFRHIVQGEPNDFLLGEKFQQGVKMLKDFNYTYDILIYHHQLKSALEFVAKLPGQKMIIDHCAKPAIQDKNIQDWKTGMMEIAQSPNVYCKLSGLFTEAKWSAWSPADFYPYLDVVFESFGIDRILVGSDWPVMLLSGMYVQWKSLLEKYMETYSEEQRQQVFGLNAQKFYSL